MATGVIRAMTCPPMRLTVPRRDYILDSEDVQSPDDYTPPRSAAGGEGAASLPIDEVKRSAACATSHAASTSTTLNFDSAVFDLRHRGAGSWRASPTPWRNCEEEPGETF